MNRIADIFIRNKLRLTIVLVCFLTMLNLVSCAKTENDSNEPVLATEVIPPISADTPTVTITHTQPPTNTPTVHPTATQTASATIQPSPTQNPNLLDKYALPSKMETYEENPELKNLILDVVFPENMNIVLVRTAFGLHFYDPQDWENLLSIDSYLELVFFDGQEGYLFKPTKVTNIVDDVAEHEFKNLIHFTWKDGILSMDAPVSFWGPNGEEMDISDFAYSQSQKMFFTESQYQRNEKGIRVIPSARYFYLYKGKIDKPYAIINVDEINSGKYAFSPDGKYFAYSHYTTGRSGIYLGDTGIESSVTANQILTHSEFIRGIRFSPDSDMILLFDSESTIGVINLETNEKNIMKLAPDLSIYDAIFFDNDTIVLCTIMGNLLMWNFVDDISTVYDASETHISHIVKYNESSVLFSVRNSLSIFNFENNMVTKVITFGEE